MEKIVKTQREKHDMHDLLLGILKDFPEDAVWDELGFYEVLYKNNNLNPILNINFVEIEGKHYCEDLAKVFDLMELSGLLIRRHERIRLDLGLIKSHFELEIKPTFNEIELDSLNKLSKKIQNELKII